MLFLQRLFGELKNLAREIALAEWGPGDYAALPVFILLAAIVIGGDCWLIPRWKAWRQSRRGRKRPGSR